MNFVKICTTFLLFCFGANLSAQKIENSLFWEISGKNLKKSSYIFGTIHLLCEKDLEIKPSVQARFDSAEVLCLEIDMDDPALPFKMMPLALMPPGTSWESLFGEKDYKFVAQYFKDSLNMPIETAKMMQPFFAFSTLYQKMLGCTPSGYDMLFLQNAQKVKKNVEGIETIEDQLAAVKSMSLKDQAKMLLEGIQNTEKSKKQFIELIEKYKKQELDKITELINSTDSGLDKEQTEAFLLKRNQNWIPTIEKMSAQQSVFYAVGAAHLAGENGVIQLLRKKGYTVKAVFF
jgi:uncharacterized protein YbaP (TraB family)